MGSVHHLIALFAYLLPLLLQLLIVIYDGVGIYDEIIKKNWDCNAADDVYIVMSVSIRSHMDNYYTIIPSIYDQLGDSVDCSI